MRSLPLLCLATVAAAAVDLDIDLAALRPQAAAVRELMPVEMRTRIDGETAAIAAASGVDPRATASRLHLSLDDHGRAAVILVGVPARELSERIAARRPQATPAVLAPDTVAVGLAGAPAPTAVPPRGSAPLSLHFVPGPRPRLPILALLEAIDAHSDGDGRIRAVLTARGPDEARRVEERLRQLRDGPASRLPLFGAAVASLGVQRYDNVVQVAIDLPPDDRAALLRLVLQRLAARMQQGP